MFGRIKKLQSEIKALDKEPQYTIPEAAVYLGVSEATVDKYMYRTDPPLIPDFRVTVDRVTQVYFRQSTLDEYKQTRRRPGRPSRSDKNHG